MSTPEKCAVCHRTNDASDGDVCEDCQRSFKERFGAAPGSDSSTIAGVITWAAGRAWEFADAAEEAWAKEIADERARGRARVGAYAPGDPGPSRWSSRRGRR